MARVQQEVVLSGHDGRRHPENRCLGLLGPLATEVAELLRPRLEPPLGGQLWCLDLSDVEMLRNLHSEADEVGRQPVAVKVDQLLQGRERPALRAVDDGCSRVVPATGIEESALAREGRGSMLGLADAPDTH